MTTASAHIFDNTVIKTRAWLADIEESLQTDSEQQAYQAMRSVLHALRDRMSIDECTDLSAQLPMLVRGIYFEGWKPSRQPVRIKHENEFLEYVAEELPANIDVRKAVYAVFKTLKDHITEGEIGHLKDNLPAQIRQMCEQGQ